MHGSRFDLTTGVPTGPPANQPVPVYPVRITDTGIDVVLPADPRRRGTWLWPQAGSLARIFPLSHARDPRRLCTAAWSGCHSHPVALDVTCDPIALHLTGGRGVS
jgi:hypothetical protein